LAALLLAIILFLMAVELAVATLNTRRCSLPPQERPETKAGRPGEVWVQGQRAAMEHESHP
jgi:hypothetical protein